MNVQPRSLMDSIDKGTKDGVVYGAKTAVYLHGVGAVFFGLVALSDASVRAVGGTITVPHDDECEMEHFKNHFICQKPPISPFMATCALVGLCTLIGGACGATIGAVRHFTE